MALGFSPHSTQAIGASLSLKTLISATGINVVLTGLQATASMGTAAFKQDTRPEPTGVQATAFLNGSVGVLISGKLTIVPPSVAATGQLGAVTVAAKANVTVTGLAAAGILASVGVAQQFPAVAGVQATGVVGDVSVDEGGPWLPVVIETTTGWSDVVISAG